MDENKRCSWCGEDPLYVAYHDEEWGVPVRDPVELYEVLMLEAFQAGLSWYWLLYTYDGAADLTRVAHG